MHAIDIFISGIFESIIQTDEEGAAHDFAQIL
jgi:hypothetical protein